ncbi:MAG TPA: hydrogenase formation protein HypD [Geobacterales bacterium]|nr:hydrogenase formation protein HypD [Geobacterales bacterium]
MNHQDEYRDRELVTGLARRIARLVDGRPQPIRLMEVCGTHTMAIHQYGLRNLLPPQVRLVSGPGCPVCVTPNSYLDRAVALGRLSDVTLATFGDMLRVPGSSTSLMEERARGTDIRIVYSPLDAVRLAQRLPERRVVFLGVGFETTAPTVAASILEAERLNLTNYSVLAAHKTMPQAMELLSADPDLGINGYLCPAHVSAIIGANAYEPLVQQFHIPCVVTGFEPADVLAGVEMLLQQIVTGESRVEIEYRRAVTKEGNERARQVMAQVFAPSDAVWRGLGTIAGSGLRIREAYGRFDAEPTLPVEVEPTREHAGCRCGDVLRGRLDPSDCPLFGVSCTPETPVGACMVSSEGSCAAAYKYGR